MTVTNPVSHTAGPWERKSIPGHLFELHNGAGDIVLRIRGGMMPMLADAKLVAAAPELLDLLHGVVDSQESNGYVGAQLMLEIRAAIAKVTA